MEEYIKITMENLKKNNMDPYFVENAEEAKSLLASMLREGDEITTGGSVTLYKTGILEMLKKGPYKYYDRFAEGLSKEDIDKIFIKAFTCDGYVTSTNAITQRGELYNVDGNSNRVAAILYGPKNVYVVAGKNKIVANIDEAVERVKKISAPKNSARLKCKTPCAITGECMSVTNKGEFMCDGCGSEARICCNYLVSAQQRIKNRIKIIIIDENVGY